MSQQEFEAACAAAIAQYHDAEFDGPLLVGTRMNTVYLGLTTGWHVWLEYAAAIGHWPTQANGSDYAQYTEHPDDAITCLERHANALCKAREPEPDEDESQEHAEFSAQDKGK